MSPARGRAILATAAAIALLVAGCASPSSGPAPAPPVDAGALSVAPGIFTVEGEPMKLVADGDTVSLWNATQGGHVLLVGARVSGLSGTVATLRGRLRDPATDAIVAEESRTVALVPAGDGSGALVPDDTLRSQVANIAVCPDANGRDMQTPYVLELIVTDTYDGRSASVRRSVTPSCLGVPSFDLERCTCECAAGFVLGKCH